MSFVCFLLREYMILCVRIIGKGYQQIFGSLCEVHH